MLKNMTLGKKIYMGFGSILLLLIIVGGISYNGLKTSTDGFSTYRRYARNTNLVGRLQANMLMARLSVKNYIATGQKTEENNYTNYFELMSGFVDEAQENIKDPKRAALIDEITENLAEYDKAFKKILEFKAQRNDIVNNILNVKGPFMEKTLSSIMISAEQDKDITAAYHAGIAMKHLLLARLYVVKFLESNEQSAIDRVTEELGKTQNELNVLDKELKNATRRKHLQEVMDTKDQYMKSFVELTSIIADRNIVISDTLDRIGPIVAQEAETVKLSYKEQQDELGPRLQAQNARSVTFIVITIILALVFGIGFAILITKGINRTLTNIIDGLNTGAEQVSAASNQVSASSQQLAEGASEQASSLEETSSSLEEISSMARQNAENSDQAKNMMVDAARIVGSVNDKLVDMVAATENIESSSEETSKIIKTIDEIAFQTNLLALNAAVEAARAGEAGAGFAVVADEVRNLAMRAADAAKSTSELIENTISAVKTGKEITLATQEGFRENAEIAGKIGKLVDEISAASSEQSQGLTQINTAVSQMDQVTQTTAANAEESASASEELTSQAAELKTMVNMLVTIVGGNNGNQNNVKKSVKAQKVQVKRTTRALVPSTVSKSAPTSVIPDDIIPLDDDFEDF